MQQDNGNNPGQQQQQQQQQQALQNAGLGNIAPNQMTAAQQAQYRATLSQQQQLQAMQAAVRAQQQQRSNGNATGNPLEAQQQQQVRPVAPQQQQQQAGQPRPPQQNMPNPAATQAQMQALQQLFQNHPEQLAAFVNMSREGRFNAEQMNQLRGAVAAAQQAQQMQQQQQQAQQQQQQQGGNRPVQPVAPQVRPNPQQQQQQQQQQQPPQQQQQQVRPTPQQQQQQQQGQARPPGQTGNAPDLQAIMLQMQKLAEPMVRRLKELEATLARPPNQGGLAAGTPERTRLEMEVNEVKQQQGKLGQQFMSVKAQYLAQQGQTQQSQQVQQQLALQQQRAAQQAAATAAASGAAVNQGQAALIANQNRSIGTPPQNIRPSPGPNVRPALDQQQQQGSRPQTPGTQQGSAVARSSPSVQGQQGKTSSTTTEASPHFQHPHVPPEAMTQRSSLISGPSNASGMAGGSGQGPFGAGIAAQLNVQPSVPEPYPNSTGPRPTLNQGLGTNPTLGTPSILQRPDPLVGSSGATGGNAGASGGGVSGWEELLGTVARESKVGSHTNTGNELDAITSDVSSAEFWDALTGQGTGADSLVNAGTTSGTTAGGAGMTSGDGRLLTKRKVQELVAEIDGHERLEGDVEDIADEFIDSVTQFSCKLAKHRKGDRLEVRDVQLHLERSWNLRIPTPGSVPIPPPRIKTSTQQTSGAKANTNSNAVTS